MRSLWGIGWTIVAVWTARVLFVVMGIAWEISTDSPFGIRVLNGIFAQEAAAPIFGNKISGHAEYSGVGSPDQIGPVTGGETNVTVCPDRDGRYPSAVGTYVGPGSSMTATASNGGGNGSVTGYRSTVTVGGPGCK
jgi:hypothetical protein